MFQVRQSTISNRSESGRFDILIIALIALLLVAGLIYVLFRIIGHSEEHVDAVRNTKVLYKESLRWRPDSDLCESRITRDINKNPDRKSADYADQNLNENSVKLIARMSKLEKLNLERSTLKDPWLEHLLPLPLKVLIVEGNPLTDSAIPCILKMKNLQSLSIGDTELTDKGLEMLSANGTITHLKLNLPRCATNDGIKHIGKMKQLTELELTNATTLTGKCLTHLSNLDNLTQLSLENMPLAPEDLKSLATLKNLAVLDISNNRLTDQSMVGVSKISSLQTLNLTGNNITGKGLMLLTKLSKLIILKAKDCPDVDEKSVAKFRLAMPRCIFEHSRTSAITEKMKRKDVKMELEFLEEEVQHEMQKSKKSAE